MNEPDPDLDARPSSFAAPAARVIARNSVLAALDTFVGLLSALVGSVAVARLLGPAKLGYYNYVLFICNITNRLASLGVPLATRKYLAEHLGRGDFLAARTIWRWVLRFQSVMALIVVALGFAVIAWQVPEGHRLYAALAVLSLAPAMQMAMYSAVNTATEDFASNVKSSLASTIVGLCGLVLALLMGWDLPGLAAALLVERTTDFFLRRHYSLRRSRGWLQDASLATAPDQLARLSGLKPALRRFCLQASLLQLLNIVVWDRSEMLFLKHFSDIRQVAFYSLGFNITQRLLLLPRAFVTAVSASVMVRIGREAESAAALTVTAFRLLAFLGLPMSFGIAALSDPFIRILYGPRFLPAIPVLALLAAFAGAKALMFPAQDLLVAANRQAALLKIMTCTACLNILLDFLLIPSRGAMGAAVANSVSQTAAAVAVWWTSLRGFEVRFPLVSFSRLLLAAVACGAVALGFVLWIPGLLGTVAAVAAGAFVYALALRLMQPLEPGDRERLRRLEAQLPGPLRNPYRRALFCLFPGR